MAGVTMNRRQCVAGLAALPLLPGCARQSEDIAMWAMGNEAAALPGLLRTIGQATNLPRVSVQSLPWSAAHEKLLTGFAGGALPALSQVGNSWIAELAAIGAIEPVPDAKIGRASCRERVLVAV